MRVSARLVPNRSPVCQTGPHCAKRVTFALNGCICAELVPHAPNGSHTRQMGPKFAPNGSHSRQMGPQCAKRVTLTPNGSHMRQTGTKCAKQVPSAPGRSLVRHTDHVHSRQTGPTCKFENPTSAPLIVPVVTITPLPLLYHVRTFYITRYTSSTTHSSQQHI